MEAALPATQLDVVQMLLQTDDATKVKILQKVTEISEPLADQQVTPMMMNSVRATFGVWLREVSKPHPVYGGPIFSSHVPPRQAVRCGRPLHGAQGRSDVPDEAADMAGTEDDK